MTSYLQPHSRPWTRVWSWPAFWRVFWRFATAAAAAGFLVGFLISGTRHAYGFPEVPIMFALVGAFLGALVGWPFGRRAAREPALVACNEAIRRDPQQAIAYFNRGQVYLWQLRDYRRAIADFDAAIRLAPHYPAAHLARVNAYQALGRLQQVISDYTRAIERDPDDAIAYCCRATAFNALGRTDKSVPDASEAIRLAPDLYLGYDARGYGLLQRGRVQGSPADLEQAVADFTQGIRLNPTDADCYLGRALAYHALGNREKAEQDEASARLRSGASGAGTDAVSGAPGPGPAPAGGEEAAGAPDLHFLGEADGPPGSPEGPFKAAMSELFATTPSVQQAYLARVAIGSSGAPLVALCLRAPEDAVLIDRITQRFRQLSPVAPASIQVLFLSEELERHLQAVCRAFYIRTQRPGAVN